MNDGVDYCGEGMAGADQTPVDRSPVPAYPIDVAGGPWLFRWVGWDR